MIDKSVEEKIKQYKTLTMPGQGFGMHMGTTYLINDLQKMIEKLEKAVCIYLREETVVEFESDKEAIEYMLSYLEQE